MTTDQSSQSTADIRVVRFDNPPVNSLSRAVRRHIVDAIAAANADPAVRAIVLAGAGKTFSAGADIREFATRGAVDDLHLSGVIAKIEASGKPVVAAVQGFALGGGLELALGCHYRVAKSGSKVGQPEIKLGIIPGAGGTQRLPRAIAFGAALDMITSGRMALVDEPALAGLFDEIVAGDPVAAAVAFARRLPAGLPRLRDQGVKGGEVAPISAKARNKLPKRSAGPALGKAIEAVEAAGKLPFDEGLALERRIFEELVRSPESKALRHMFFAEREAARIPDVPADTPTYRVEHVGVIGAGTMGIGISLAFLNAGFSVTLVDAKPEAVARAQERIASTLEQAVAKGTLAQADAAGRLAKLQLSTAYAATAEADLMIEAVFEDMAVKQDVLPRLDRIARPDAVIATNTSTLDVNRLAEFTKRPERFIGLHFFSPANVMRLLEIVRGARTSKETLATAMRIARQLGKVGVVAGVCDGFIGNRMLEEYLRQAYFLLDEGALPQAVDGVLERWGMAMGPFRMMDLVGNDVGYLIRQRRMRERPDQPYSPIPDRICEIGRHGQKTGTGFYRYESGSRSALPDPAIEALIVDYSREIGLERRRIEDAEIVARCIYALVNEGARILDEGIALRASDIDIVYMTGYGYPPTRGGPMFTADTIGLTEIVGAMKRFESGYQGRFWKPAPLIERLAASGHRFND